MSPFRMRSGTVAGVVSRLPAVWLAWLAWLTCLALMLIAAPVQAGPPGQTEGSVAGPGPNLGPVIENYGPVYGVGDAYGLEAGTAYRAVLDVSGGPEDVSALNPSIESAARFLNMHAQPGAPRANLQLAVVLHGTAGKDALSNAAYQARFGVDNPNDGLLAALAQAEVAIYLCGQTAGFRGYAESELHPAVTMAVSAMTVLTRLQHEGWAVLP